MHNKSYIRNLAAWSLMLFVSACWASPRDLTVAEVHVYQEQLSGKVRYTYVVTNNGNSPITGIEVGFDYYLGEPELSGQPPLQVKAPSGWTSRVTAMEESDLYSIGWDSGTNTIQPGQMRAGFVVETNTPNIQMLTTHWTITADGPIVSASDKLVHIGGPAPVDTVPPLISATATPSHIWPPNGQMTQVSIAVNVSDESDPSPDVRLVSIMCNECAIGDIAGAVPGTDDRSFFVRAKRLGMGKDGRVYTATYEATDSSGNAATTLVRIAVPHDQKR
jgi:hypothetical protein